MKWTEEERKKYPSLDGRKMAFAIKNAKKEYWRLTSEKGKQKEMFIDKW